MLRVGWFDEKRYGSGPKYLLFIIATLAVLLGLLRGIGIFNPSASKQYSREDREFHGLPAAPHVLVEPPEHAAIVDKNPYAEDEALDLYAYICYYYSGDMLTAKADYDEEGRLSQLGLWEYDMAGNVFREQTKSNSEETWTTRHIYEYDSSDRIVHEELYWDEDLVERSYFRYTDVGRAGVTYSYFDEQVDGGISQYCSYHTEFMEDMDGNPLRIFNLHSNTGDIPYEVWKLQWDRQDDHIVNRVQYYERGLWMSNRSDWYRDRERADMEQVNLYEYNPETDQKNHILELNYEWSDDQDSFCLTPSFYWARYDGDLLRWQMSYSDGGLIDYTVCQYDADGRLKSGVRYEAGEEEGYAVFHRYEYPGQDRTEQYSYYIQGPEFRQSFGDGDSALFTFSETGILSGVEMTDAAGNIIEQYEFGDAGENLGKLERMYTGADMTVGETAILEKLEEEARTYGFQAGEALKSYAEGSGE